MPLYYYQCSLCNKESRRLCTPDESKVPPICCKKAMVRSPRPPSQRATEILDNGIMTKRLERLVDAERLFHDRVEAVKKEQKGE